MLPAHMQRMFFFQIDFRTDTNLCAIQIHKTATTTQKKEHENVKGLT